MKRFSIPPREERERHSHTMSAYICSKKAMSRNQRFLLENHSLNSATRALLTSIFSLIPE